MKTVKFLALIILIWSSQAMALPPMGPPKADLEQGQYSVGSDYSFSVMDIELSGYGLNVTQKDVDSNMIFANLGYGIAPNLEAFVRLGAANAEFEGFSGDTEFAYGFGTKATFAQEGDLTWGGLFQMSWANSEDTGTLILDGHTITGTQEIDFYEIQIAVGPTYKMEGFSIYGGPFLHIIDGKYDWNGTVTGPIVNGSGSFSLDVKQESELGLYIGALFDINENVSCSVEYQQASDAYGICTGLRWRF